jgi:death-on-curing family protein
VKKKQIMYLSIAEMIEFNILVLSLIKTKKADKSEVLSYQKIMDITHGCKELKGDIYDKAVYLLKNIIQKHVFASGNRRTAFIITKHFLVSNEAEFNIVDAPEHARIMTGIRENYYSDNEIKNRIKDGEIKEFTRR